MKEIFEKIKGRQWDWFGIEFEANDGCEGFWSVDEWIPKANHVTNIYSLADLLANKSFTDACGLPEPKVLTAFYELREYGEKKAIEFIKSNIDCK